MNEFPERRHRAYLLVRNKMFRNRSAQINGDFYTLKLVKVVNVNFYCSCLFPFKSLNNLSEPSNYFNYVNNNRYDLRNNSNLRQPFSRTLQGQRSPSYYCPDFWNTLPTEIRNLTFLVLKSALKNIH